jgi:hypothetical protein
MRGGFIGKRCHVQAAQGDMRAASAVVVGDAIGTIRGGDVDLDNDEVGRVVQIEHLDVLVLNLHIGVRVEIGRQRREAEWREE